MRALLEALHESVESGLELGHAYCLQDPERARDCKVIEATPVDDPPKPAA
jgi:hypothetical protein